MSKITRSKLRSSKQQIAVFLSYCERHPFLKTSKPSSTDNDEIWTELVNSLNGIHGPKKTIEQWKKSLSHWRHQVQSRERRSIGKRRIFQLDKAKSHKNLDSNNKFNQHSNQSADKIELHKNENVLQEKNTLQLDEAESSVQNILSSIIEDSSDDTSKRRENSTIISSSQINFYKEFCEEHPQFKKSRCRENDRLWKELIDQLNMMDGPTHSIEVWKLALSYRKHSNISRDESCIKENNCVGKLKKNANDIENHNDSNRVKQKKIVIGAQSYKDVIKDLNKCRQSKYIQNLDDSNTDHIENCLKHEAELQHYKCIVETMKKRDEVKDKLYLMRVELVQQQLEQQNLFQKWMESNKKAQLMSESITKVEKYLNGI